MYSDLINRTIELRNYATVLVLAIVIDFSSTDLLCSVPFLLRVMYNHICILQMKKNRFPIFVDNCCVFFKFYTILLVHKPHFVKIENVKAYYETYEAVCRSMRRRRRQTGEQYRKRFGICSSDMYNITVPTSAA